MARAIHCTVVEVPPMSDYLGSHAGGFEDLVPWADPYIKALVEKLKRTQELEQSLDQAQSAAEGARAELPPPLESDNDLDSGWQVDWSSRDLPGH